MSEGFGSSLVIPTIKWVEKNVKTDSQKNIADKNEPRFRFYHKPMQLVDVDGRVLTQGIDRVLARANWYIDSGQSGTVVSNLSNQFENSSTDMIDEIYWHNASEALTPQAQVFVPWLNSNVSQPLLWQSQRSLTEELKDILSLAASEDIEDGTRSMFIDALGDLINRRGAAIFPALTALSPAGETSPEVIAEILRWLPELCSNRYRHDLLWILKHHLFNKSNWIRYGAALGLASLKDNRAISYLRDAIRRERISDLRQDLEQIVSYLEQG
jgi:hypothetical protein